MSPQSMPAKKGNPKGWLVNSETRYPLFKNRVVAIGRLSNSKTNDRVERIEISNIHISTTHCYIWLIQFDTTTPCICYLQDKGSNSCSVNGITVGYNNFTILHNTDTVQLYDDVYFKYISEESTLESVNGGVTRVKDWTILPEIIGIGTFGKVV